MDFRAGDAHFRSDPRMAYVAPQLAQMWSRDLDRYAKASPADAEALKNFYQLGLRLTGQAHRAGVKIMAGTDSNDTMIFPGFSLHDELGNLVAAGLSPMDALRAATTVPAEYLRRRADFGSLSPGHLADIVLLGADPMANIGNTKSIFLVMQGGKVFDRSELDALLEKARLLAAGISTKQ
jgi:imidazolonepropionase-like amidohydrolase